MEDGLVLLGNWYEEQEVSLVLILVVMEDGLVQDMTKMMAILKAGLNPCCNGRWSRTYTSCQTNVSKGIGVLILVVMEDGLVLFAETATMMQY